MSFHDLTKELSRDLSFRILDQVIVEHEVEFIPNAFQLFPERYVAPDRNSRVLCVDYDMGTGKTLSAALAISRLLSDMGKIEEELRKTGNMSLLAKLPRPYVIGNWSSVEAFEEEFMRPMFGIVGEDEYAELIASRTIEDTGQYEHLRQSLAKRVHQKIRMASYQKMFNRYFRNATILAVKDEKSLNESIASGKIVIDPTIVLELSNSILIIDELQMLYSGHGWNTYGFLLDHIRQNPDIRNLTVIALSGTFINSSPVEMVHVYNLIRDKYAPRIIVDDYFDKELVGIQTYTYTPKKSKEEDLVRLFDGKVASYRISPSKDYPEVIADGEMMKIGDRKFQWLKLYRCPAPPYQWEQYLASYESLRGTSIGEERKGKGKGKGKR